MVSPVTSALRRPLHAFAAMLLAAQALLTAWHGAALSALNIDAASATETVVICTAHGFVRVALDENGEPHDPTPNRGGGEIKCSLCLALAAVAWAPLTDGLQISPPGASIVAFQPWANSPSELAPRSFPRQRGPPLHA